MSDPIVETPQPETTNESVPVPKENQKDEQPFESSDYLPVKKPKKDKKPLVIILLILLLVAFIGAATWWFIVKKPAKTTQTTMAVQKHDISKIRFGTSGGDINIFYPSGEGFSPDLELNTQVFEGLVQYSQNGIKIAPLLASSWTNPDSTTWIFKLKQGVKFHSGRIMTAKDVVYSLTNLKDNYYWQTYGATIREAKALDDYTVQIKTNGTDPLLLNRLTALYIVDSQSTAKNDAINGTGPYIVKPGTTPKPEETDLVAFDSYHDGHVYTREVQLKSFGTDDDVAAAYKKGEIDIAETNFAKAKLTPFVSANSELFSDQLLLVYELQPNLNQKGSPLQNLKVRQALTYAIDQAKFIQAEGVDGKPASQLVPQAVTGYDPTITFPKRDVSKAKQLLAEAGYPNGVTLTMAYVEGYHDDAMAELVKDVRDAGITLELNPASPDTYGDDIVSGKYQMFFLGNSSVLNDLSDVVTENFQGSNYDNPEVDSLLKQADQTLDGATRLKILQQISRKLSDDVAAIPFYTLSANWIVPKNLVFERNVSGGNFGVLYSKVYKTSQ